MKAVAYFFMLVFYANLIAGTVWLIEMRNWSPWWFAMTIVLMMASGPNDFFIEWIEEAKEGEVK